MADQSEEEKKHLNSWIVGLFNPDGLTDEVMSVCRPQDMYMLVPSITSQAVAACAHGVLDINTVKQGLECTLPPESLSRTGTDNMVQIYNCLS